MKKFIIVLLFFLLQFSVCAKPNYKYQIDNNNWQYWNNQGNISSDTKDYQTAISYYNNGLKLNPYADSIYFNRGVAYHCAGLYQDAIKDYEKALLLNSHNNTARIYLSLAQKSLKIDSTTNLQNNDIQNSSKPINEQNNNVNKSWQEYFNNGNKQYQLKNYKEAIQEYTKSLQIHQDESTFYNRGLAKYNLELYKDSIEDFTYAIRLKPSKKAFRARGNAKYKLKDYEGAKLDYEYSSTDYINNPAKKYNSDSVLKSSAYQQVANNNFSPNDNSYIDRGNSKYDKKDYRGTKDDYTKALNIKTNVNTYQEKKNAKLLLILKNYKGVIDNLFKFIYLFIFLYYISVSAQNFINEKINYKIPTCNTTINKEYNNLYGNLSINSQAPDIENYNLTHDDINQIPKYIDCIQKAQNISIEDTWKWTVCVAILVTWLFTNRLCSSVIPFLPQVIIISAVLYNPVKYIKIAFYCHDIDNTTFTKEKIRNYIVYKGLKELYEINMEPIRQAEEIKLKQKRDYWVKYWSEKQQNGFIFEEAVGNLFKKLGYRVNVTQGSGDGGVDIEIWKDGKKGIIQCKAHKHQVGPKDIRELWGVKDDFKADFAIFVAYSGVTSGAYDFTQGKDYIILDKDNLVKLSLKAHKEEIKYER